MKYKMVIYQLLFLLTVTFAGCSNEPELLQNKTILLDDGWMFSMEGEEQVYPAVVPGTVQTDLLANNKIPQPFYRDNEKQCQWIDKQNWIYSKKFTVDSSDLKYNSIYINFKGLDTYAEVYLNNHLILNADNMFRSWKANVSDKLKEGENIITVKFTSPVEIGLAQLNNLGYPLPAVNDQSEVGGLDDKKVSVFTRKAPYHYGWDWGPRFVTMGIWRPVELHFINKAEITDMYILQKSVTSENAEINALITVNNCQKGDYKLIITNVETNEKYISKDLNLSAKDTLLKFSFVINKPRLWWPNGYGDQNLYSFKANLSKSGYKADELIVTAGLRDIKVITEPDSIGKSFYFMVNGIPVFAKGANYIPNDNFLPRVSNQKYETIVKSAVDANMNMLRVWGGGIYENDIFYELCDRYGILLWHDFMFACSMYPGDSSFLENVSKEAVENVVRLRNHPSIALWCGNNEIDAAWCNAKENCGWSWKENYNSGQRAEIWKSYDTIFHNILPYIIAKYDETRFYWPSSPLSDWGVTASYDGKSGDMHYWGVWHGSQPFESFREVKSRFMSEYGFQSFPEFNTIKEFTLPQDWDIYSDIMLEHQRSPIGNQKIKEYMENYYPVPENFNDFIYVGQLLQAYGIKQAIDNHRIDKPYCMGTLFWQLNDCWPGASWSGIDYYTNWKALQYKVRDAYEPLRLAVKQTNTQIEIFVLNDKPEIDSGSIDIQICSFKGDKLFTQSKNVHFNFEKSTCVYTVDLKHILPEVPENSSFLQADLYVGNKKTDSEIHYFVDPKELNLPESSIKYTLKKKSDYYVLDLQSENLEKDVAVYIPGVSANYSDNYFDLLPGESKELKIILKTSVNDVLEKGVIVHTLNKVKELK